MSKILSFVLLGGFLSSVGFGIFQMIKGVANMLFNLAYRHRYPIEKSTSRMEMILVTTEVMLILTVIALKHWGLI